MMSQPNSQNSQIPGGTLETVYHWHPTNRIFCRVLFPHFPRDCSNIRTAEIRWLLHFGSSKVDQLRLQLRFFSIGLRLLEASESRIESSEIATGVPDIKRIFDCLYGGSSWGKRIHMLNHVPTWLINRVGCEWFEEHLQLEFGLLQISSDDEL